MSRSTAENVGLDSSRIGDVYGSFGGSSAGLSGNDTIGCGRISKIKKDIEGYQFNF